MNSRRTKRFRDLYRRLPEIVRNQAVENYGIWKSNPWHPSLRFKKVHTSEEIWSVRINRDFRALCHIIDGTAVWFWIGSHDEYEQLLGKI